MARWVFVRHGESVANLEGWLAGHRDVALTARGEQQARALGPALPAWDRIWASDLQRAWRTAELAAPGAPIERFPALRERHLGSCEGRLRSDLIASGEMALLVGWATAPAGAESQRDLARRVLAFLADHERPGCTVMVAHGGVLRVLEGLHLAVDPGAIGTRVVANAEILDWELPIGRWSALAGAADLPEPAGPRGAW